MKRTLGIVFIIVASVLAAQESDTRRNFVLNTLKRFTPQGYHIINSILKSPESGTVGIHKWSWQKDDFMIYVKSVDEYGMVREFNTMVHEMNHVYTGGMAKTLSEEVVKDPSGKYWSYFTGTETVIVKKTETFPSKEIASIIPEKLRGMRYKYYIINPDMKNSTQCHGIYGLLDEFNSYYHGTRVSVDMLDWYKLEKQHSADGWGNLITEVNKSYMAHMEFKLYILAYLFHAKKEYPHIYQGIMANSPFKKVFAAVDGNWKRLIDDFYNTDRNIARVKQDKSIAVEKHALAGPLSVYLKLTQKGKSEWLCLPWKVTNSEYSKYEKEMEKPEYRELLAELAAKTNKP